MDIATAERALARYVAQRCPSPDTPVLAGNSEIPETPPMVRLRFVSGTLGTEELREFTAELRGAFAEPEEASGFADAVWGALPAYGAEGFTVLERSGEVGFAECEGDFTVSGRLRACFA